MTPDGSSGCPGGWESMSFMRLTRPRLLRRRRRSTASSGKDVRSGARWLPHRSTAAAGCWGRERLLDDLPRDSWVLPGWPAGDPLDGLFRVWFGAYGTSAQGVSLEKQFAAHASPVRLDADAEVPADAASWLTTVSSMMRS